MSILPLAAQLFSADGVIFGRAKRHDEANSRFFFRNFAKAPKNGNSIMQINRDREEREKIVLHVI